MTEVWTNKVVDKDFGLREWVRPHLEPEPTIMKHGCHQFVVGVRVLLLFVCRIFPSHQQDLSVEPETLDSGL